MRKLKLQVQMTVDGFIGGPNGELDFITWNWDEKLKKYVGELTKPIGTIVLGRKLAEGFIPYWANVANDAGNPEVEAGRIFTNTPKVVFSNTLDQSKWENTIVAKGNIVDEINKLKNQPGGDIIAYGGSTFVSDLIKHNLVDEYHLFINPSAIGKGLPIFNTLSGKHELKLVKALAFDCGIVVLNYEAKRG